MPLNLSLDELDRLEIRMGIRRKNGTITAEQYEKASALLDDWRRQYHRRHAREAIDNAVNTAKAILTNASTNQARALASKIASDIVYPMDELIDNTLPEPQAISSRPAIRERPTILGLGRKALKLGRKPYDPFRKLAGAWEHNKRIELSGQICAHGKAFSACIRCRHMLGRIRRAVSAQAKQKRAHSRLLAALEAAKAAGINLEEMR